MAMGKLWAGALVECLAKQVPTWPATADCVGSPCAIVWGYTGATYTTTCAQTRREHCAIGNPLKGQLSCKVLVPQKATYTTNDGWPCSMHFPTVIGHTPWQHLPWCMPKVGKKWWKQQPLFKMVALPGASKQRIVNTASDG